ncbi:MAG: hypothetical protein IEMM0006_0039 [bacterium]|nr:MAG: hypothetical protein IEMM0006_0039 [bacterium]
MNEIIKKQDQELQNVIYKVPALITLFVASQATEGHLVPTKERTAKVYLSILSNQADEALQDFFQEVKKTFDKDIETLNEELPKEAKKRKEKIEQLLQPVVIFLSQLPRPLGVVFKDALLGFVSHARDFRQDFLESVLLPFISDDLRKIENDRLRRILD